MLHSGSAAFELAAVAVCPVGQCCFQSFSYLQKQRRISGLGKGPLDFGEHVGAGITIAKHNTGKKCKCGRENYS